MQGQAQGEQRYPLVAADERGLEHQGELVLAPAWRPELAQGPPEGAFRIVLLLEALGESPPLAPGVALCVPARPFALPRALREPGPAYGAPAAPALPAGAMAALGQGFIVTADPTRLRPAEVFPAGERRPRLEVLSQSLLAARQRREAAEAAAPFVRALALALAAPQPAPSTPEIEDLQAQITRHLAAVPARYGEPLGRLGDLAALRDLAEAPIEALAEVARRHYASPAELAEAVYLCRALARGSQEAEEMAAMRSFLAAAVVPEERRDLAWDRTLTLEQLSFAALVVEPHRLPSMRALFRYFRYRYHHAYLEHHRYYWQGMARLRQELEEGEGLAGALGRLDALAELGPPLGAGALAELGRLRLAVVPCPRAEAPEAKAEAEPRCPDCGIALTEAPPEAQAREVQQRLERALGRQLQRLSSRLATLILGQEREPRLERFLKVAQVSDLGGLAAILDDALLDFLRQLLREAPPVVQLSPILAELQQAFPQVGAGDVEAVVAELRRLLVVALLGPGEAALGLPPLEAP